MMNYTAFNVYITGANGFIGRNLIQFFRQIPNCNVFGISLGRNSIIENTIYSDYIDYKWLKNQINQGNTIVIHTAAVIPNAAEIKEQSILLKNRSIDQFISNVFGEIAVAKLFYFSSLAVYGYGYGNLENVSEASAFSIHDYYAQGKAEGEELFFKQFKESSYYTLRLSSPYGMGMKRGVINQFYNQAVAGESITLYGKGKRTQDFIYVRDINEILQLLITKSIEPGAYNLASGITCEMNELAVFLIHLLKSRSLINFIDKPESNFVSVQNEKLKKAIGFNFTAISEGLRDMVRLKGAGKK